MAMNRRTFGRTLAGAAAATVTSGAWAQSYPVRPITIIVGFAAGGGVDVVVRSLTPALTASLGQNVVVDNRPGGASIIAASAVAKAGADGYTLFGSDGGAFVLNTELFRTLPYDPDKDFVPVSALVRAPLLIAAHPSFPANDLRGLVAEAKRTPLSYASAGKGTFHHLAMERLKRRAGFDAADIAYKGAGPAMQDVLAGQVPLISIDSIVALPNLRAGKIKALAVLTAQRLPQLPDAQTAAEQGFSGVEAYAWIGIAAPRGTSPEIVMRLSSEIRKALQLPDIAKRFTDLGMEPYGTTPEQFSAFIASEATRWRPLVTELGLKLD
ncbi:MAG TPA: tripartite tricarboxylate transporter substrate-binding protein [Burkholderiaceae bacterium]|nr:tripartite tricarboxylate transporter substrate-binding protein [Burkholderiaceae bacterium]